VCCRSACTRYQYRYSSCPGTANGTFKEEFKRRRAQWLAGTTYAIWIGHSNSWEVLTAAVARGP